MSRRDYCSDPSIFTARTDYDTGVLICNDCEKPLPPAYQLDNKHRRAARKIAHCQHQNAYIEERSYTEEAGNGNWFTEYWQVEVCADCGKELP